MIEQREHVSRVLVDERPIQQIASVEARKSGNDEAPPAERASLRIEHPDTQGKRMQQDEHAIGGSVACIDESTRPAPDRGYFQ